MNKHCMVAHYSALSVKGITVALAATLLASLMAIFALGERSQAAENDIVTAGPANVGFGAIQVGQESDTRTIYVRNTGNDTLQFNLNLLDVGGLPTSDFELVDPLPGGVLTVGPGGATVQVKFTPTAEGARLAELNFTAVGGGDAPPSVSLDGTGTNTDPFIRQGVQPDCTIVGTPSGDRITGTAGQDIICALGGADKVDGQRDNDVMRGAGGNDRIKDRAGKDKLYGQSGRDRLNARDGRGKDLLVGGPRRDRIAKDKRDRVRR